LVLEIAPFGTNVLLTWTNSSAALEQSRVLTGAWGEVTGAASPYLVPATNVASFYRLRLSAGGPFDFRYVAPTFTTGVGDPTGCGCTSPENPNSLSTGGSGQDNGEGSVFLHTGELTQHAVDLVIPGRGMDWRFERRYRSGMSYDGPLGHEWEFNYNRRLAVQANGDVLRADGLGRVDRYAWTGTGYDSPRGFYTRLTRNPDGTFDERDRHGTVHTYGTTNALGIARLTRIRDRNGNEMTLDYNVFGQLANVFDTLGRSIAYAYDGDGRLALVTDFASRVLQFAYDPEGNLVRVTSPAVTGTPNGNDFPLGKTTQYTYSSGYGDSRLNHNLLTVTAPNEFALGGPPRLVAQYDTDPASTNADRVARLSLGGTNASGIGAGGTITCYELI
jgi:YD repeat-containing protein